MYSAVYVTALAQAAYAAKVQQMRQANSLPHPKPCRYCGQDDWGKHSCKRCGAPGVHLPGEGEK